MKIIFIHNNLHASQNSLSEPIFFLKPDTSLFRGTRHFFIPHLTKQINCGLSPVIRINKVGKNIAEKFTHRYWDEIGVGLDLTDTTKLEECKKNNLPWEVAKSFEESAPLGLFLNKNDIPDIDQIVFSLKINETIKQEIKTDQLNYSIPFIISYLSRYFTIKTGDLIYLGTPEIQYPLKINDSVQGFIGNELLLNISIK